LEKRVEVKQPRVSTNIIPNQVITNKTQRGMLTNRDFRSIEITEYPNIVFYAGTEDKNKLKSCFLEIKGTFQTEQEDRMRTINGICKKISQTVNSALNKDLFREEFLLNKDIPDSFIKTGKCFTKLEYTFFPKRQTTYEEIKKELNTISNYVWNNNIQDSDKMKFHKRMMSKKRYAKR
jgi:hypothetical protein